MSEPLYIYTDGSFYQNTGGWASVFVFKDHHKKMYGFVENTTSANRMEITGILESLKVLENSIEKLHFIENIHIISDSEYCVKTCSEWLYQWIVKGETHKKKNMDLWGKVYKHQIELMPHFNIKYEWIKGHAGHKYNEIADQLANFAREQKINKLRLSNPT